MEYDREAIRDEGRATRKHQRDVVEQLNRALLAEMDALDRGDIDAAAVARADARKWDEMLHRYGVL